MREENVLLLMCGLGCTSSDPHEEPGFVGIALADETLYDFTSRLLESGRYTRVAAVPFWRLPQHSLAWQQFLDHNREGAV